MTVIVLEVRDGELLTELTRLAAEAGIANGAICSLIGAADEFTISVMEVERAAPDVVRSIPFPAEMTGTGEIVNGIVHLHVMMAVADGRIRGGHLRAARISTWFARAYVIPVPDSSPAYAFARLPDRAEAEAEPIRCADCDAEFVTAGKRWMMCPVNARHHMHADAGTVERCGGCFADWELHAPETSDAEDRRLPDRSGAGWRRCRSARSRRHRIRE